MIMLSEEEQQLLLTIARKSIKHGLEHGTALKLVKENYPPALQQERAVFITLKINSQLRGCIGTTETSSSIVQNVADYAFRAAFHDPRFSPLDKDEFDQITLSISILSANEPVEFTSETDLLNQIRPGIDGLIIEKGNCRATFLPSVWETLPDTHEFLRQLKLKANIPTNESPGKAWRYHADIIQEI